MHRTRLAKLELLHASRIATFGLLGFGLLAAGLSAAFGGLRLNIDHQGEPYSHLLELGVAQQAMLIVGGLVCVAVVIYSLAKMERAQDRIIDMKLKSDQEAEEIIKYDYEDYKKEHDLRFAISPILMVVSLVVSAIALTIWMNEVILGTEAAAAAFYFGVILGLVSVGDQFLLWGKYRQRKDG